ncbi:MAG: hypothetical protein E7279_00835 [Lachnospiraceae bacterium]|nr:hypothetical protein [Lachnospiraceae bacterium]
MEYDLTYLNNLGLDTSKGLEYMRSEDKYISAVQRYYKSYDNNLSKLTEFYNNKDYKNYCIVVHSLKSNSKMIGQNNLAQSFAELEIAANDSDYITINKNHSIVLEEWGKFITKLKPIGEMKLIKPEDEITSSEAKEITRELLIALDDFDDELSSELIHKLSGYPFRLTQRELLDKAIEYVEDFLYDDAATIIKDIEKTIE